VVDVSTVTVVAPAVVTAVDGDPVVPKFCTTATVTADVPDATAALNATVTVCPEPVRTFSTRW
jgi:hypothetical protein